MVQVTAAAVIAPPVNLMPVEVPLTSAAPAASVNVPPQLLDTVFTHFICEGLVGKVSLNETEVIFTPELFSMMMRVTLVAVPPESVTGLVRNDFLMVGLGVTSRESLPEMPIP